MKVFTSVILIVLGITLSTPSDALYIRNWLLCGPFQEAKLESKIIEDEAGLSPKESDVSLGVKWEEFNSVENIIDFEGPIAFGKNERCVGYAYCEIISDKNRTVLLKVGSDDGIKIWINGENILDNDVARGLHEQDIVTAYLKKGKNRFLIKVNDKYIGWGFYCNILDRNGKEIEGLEFDPEAIPLGRVITEKIKVTSIQGEDTELFNPVYMLDGDAATRWSSQHSDPQQVTLEFGQPEKLKRIDLVWETACGKKYSLSTSVDGENWDEIYSTDSGKGGHEIILLEEPVKAKFLRFEGLERGTDWGYSLYEFKVYGFKEKGTEVSYEKSLKTLKVVWPKPLTVEKVTASSTQPPYLDKEEYFYPELACDNDLQTRWSSGHDDPQWITLDFGKEVNIGLVKLVWESAYAKKFKVEISIDGENWKEVYAIDQKKDSNIDLIKLDDKQRARYLQLTGEQRGTDWGYSLWEIQAFGEDN